MLLNVFNEYNIPVELNGFKLNVSDERSRHDRRIKIIGKGTKKGNSTCVPVKEKILTFDELLNDDHTYRDNSNGTGRYLELVIGFVIMHHGKLINYFNAVSRYDTNLPMYRNAIDIAFAQYVAIYNYNDISRIRNDANDHVKQIKAGIILDT